jgi:hypothetical protein
MLPFFSSLLPVSRSAALVCTFLCLLLARLPAAQLLQAEPDSADAPRRISAATFPGQPFWIFAAWGSGIGGTNITVLPAAPSTPPEIVLGGQSDGNYNANDFWQVVRWNPATRTYDQLFVTSLYASPIRRIELGDVIGDARQELVVLLSNGTIYFYDAETKAAAGSFNSGANGAEGLSLTDLDGDTRPELIVTTVNDLFVLRGNGALLWQLPGAGGYEVVVGQMDDDSALEIATTNGSVVDAGTRAVQWMRAGGFGRQLALAPLEGAGYQQLIAGPHTDKLQAYDVRTQLARWSISLFSSLIGAIRIADVDNDGTPELLFDQLNFIYVYNLSTRALKWNIDYAGGPVTDIVVRDVDNDGMVDLVWGDGWQSTAGDHLLVASTTGNRGLKWKSVDFRGPFIGPHLGDLDGDGNLELVACSSQSESEYAGGHIVVFDAATLTLRGISPVAAQFGRIRDVKLHDFDGDGRTEIVVACDANATGTLDIYSFDSANVFTRKWRNPERPYGSPFDFVEVADLDNNGIAEIIVGNSISNSGSDGVYVYIYDYLSNASPWRSTRLATAFSGVIGLTVADLDKIGGTKEIAALLSTGNLYTFDGPSRQLRNIRPSSGFTTLSRRPTEFGLVGGDNRGVGHFLRYLNDGYVTTFTRQFWSTSLTGINVLPNAALWVGTGAGLRLYSQPAYDTVAWETPTLGRGFGRTIARELRGGEERIFTAGNHAIVGLVPPHHALAFVRATSRHRHGDGALDIVLPATGQPATEPRSGSPSGNHSIVFAFNHDVVSAAAEISSGVATISGSPVIANNTVTVRLTGIANAQSVTIKLRDVFDTFGQVVGEASTTVGFLLGDTNGDGAVNAGDVQETRSRSGQAADGRNFRSDVNADGTVNSADSLLVRARSGQFLP